MFTQNKYKNYIFIIVKFSKQILEAIKQGVNLALDDYENDINVEAQGQSKSDVIGNNIVNTVDSKFIKVMNNNDFGSLGATAIKNVYKNISHYLALIHITEEQFHIIKYMQDRDLIGYLDDNLKQIYEKYSSLFTSKYRKVMDKGALQKIILDTIKAEGTECDLNWIDVSGITDMSCLFLLHGVNDDDSWLMHNFNGDISKWDVSNVNNMEMMFSAERVFNGDISKWNVSNVKNMCGMFWNANKFNCDISKWNVSNVEVFSGMFAGATSFNQNLSKWNISNAKKIKYMFDDCPINAENLPRNFAVIEDSLNESFGRNVNLALDDYEDDETLMSKNNIISTTNTIDDKVINAIRKQKFYELSQNIQKHVYKNIEHYLELLGITMEEYYIIRYMVDHNLKDNLDKRLYQKYYNNMTLFHSKYRKVTSKEELQFIIKQAIMDEGYDCNLNWIDVSGITDMNNLFYYSVRNENIKEFKYFNGDISEWDVSNVDDMSYMFYGCEKFNGDISKWNVSNVKNMVGTFACAREFNQDISKWDVSNVEDMNMMFMCAESFNKNISNWNISSKNNCTPNSVFVGCPIKKEFKPKKFQVDENAEQ